MARIKSSSSAIRMSGAVFMVQIFIDVTRVVSNERRRRGRISSPRREAVGTRGDLKFEPRQRRHNITTERPSTGDYVALFEGSEVLILLLTHDWRRGLLICRASGARC